MTHIRIIVNNGYHFVNDLLPILFYEVDNTFLHNKRQVEIQGVKSRNTFEGTLACEASCYLMKYFLERFETDYSSSSSSCLLLTCPTWSTSCPRTSILTIIFVSSITIYFTYTF